MKWLGLGSYQALLDLPKEYLEVAIEMINTEAEELENQ